MPLHIGLLFDTSESMELDLSFSRTAAIKFLSAFPKAVDFSLVDFDTEVRAARFLQSEFPRLVERIQRELRATMGPPHAAARGTWQWKNGRRILKLNWRGRGSARWIYVQMEDGDLLARISHYTAARR